MSILTIYQTHLTPERNALVDELDWYLENEAIETFKFNEFQYQQLGLDLMITIPADQENITNQTVGNYLTIQQDNETWYYFILSYEWTSRNAITIEASIDSVNTFRDKVEWSSKTTITRQHEDRFSITDNYVLERKIDMMSEGIETTKRLIEDTKIQQSNDELDWFLVYRTASDDGPIADKNIPFETYLCANRPLAVELPSQPTTSSIITSSTLTDNYEYILNKDNPIAVLSLPSRITPDLYELRDLRLNDRILWVSYYGVPLQGFTTITYEITVKNIVIKKDGENVSYYINWSNPVLKEIGSEYFSSPSQVSWNFEDTDQFVWLDAHQLVSTEDVFESNDVELYDYAAGTVSSITVKTLALTRTSSTELPIQDALISDLPTHVYNIGSYATQTIGSFEEIDRTMKPLMKVLRLPYAPITIEKQDTCYKIPGGWELATFSLVDETSLTLLKLKREYFINGFLANIGSVDINKYLTYFPTISAQLSNSARNIDAESKLFSSEFLTVKFIYDSFSTAIGLEQFQPQGGIHTGDWHLPIRYKQTNTTASTFLFDLGFNQLYLSNPSVNMDYNQFSDYEQYLVVSRNNEEALYGSDYLDYMRYGYNYDRKQTAETVAQGWLSVFGSGVHTAGQAFGAMRDRSDIAANRRGSANFQRGLRDVEGLNRDQRSQISSLQKSTAARKKSGATTGLLWSKVIERGVDTAIGLINQSIATEQAWRSLRQKQFELKQQAVSVSGSDDIDLLKYYNDNKLHFVVYDTVELQKEAAHNLFHYCGYSRAKQGIPNFTGRYWFNYIQCSPMFKGEELHPYNAFLNDIKARYETGITVYHRHYNAAGAGQSYDWEQEFENWEDNVVYEKYTTDMLKLLGTTIRAVLTYQGPEIDNYYAWIEAQDSEGNEILNTKDTTTNITYGRTWTLNNVARVRINTRQPEQASDWLTIGG